MRALMNDGQHHNNFDLIRLFAALQVAGLHTLHWLDVPSLHSLPARFLRSFPGVVIFFVVSGFLVTQSYLRNKGDLRAYFVNRALRIYPALWLQYAVVIVVMAATGGFHFETIWDSKFWLWLTSAGTLGSNFYANLAVNWSPFDWTGVYKYYPADVLWTIPVELGFYVLVPIVLCASILRRNLQHVTILGAMLISAIILLMTGNWLTNYPSFNATGVMHSSAAPYFWIFLLGSAASVYWNRIRFLFERRAAVWIALHLALCYLAGSFELSYRDPGVVDLIRVVVLAGVVISAAYTATRLSLWLKGFNLSYGIYLFHMPLPLYFYSVGLTGYSWLLIPVAAATILVALFSWRIVERPALQLKGRLASSHPLAPPLASSGTLP
jgi:peptidoglycan/LPS O-acetylase OafA/YrhL